MPQNRQSEAGNVFMLILLGVVLFGALAFTVARGVRSDTTSAMSTRQAELAATNILNYAQRIERAVNRLRRNGCSETEISFENQVITNYTNINSPGDNSCHIFEKAGGGLNWQTPNEKWLDTSQSANFNYQNYVFSSVNRVINLGANIKDDLLFFVNWLDQSVCEQINKQLFQETIITQDPSSFSYGPSANGTFDTVTAGIDLSSLAIHDGQASACFTSENNGGFHFYHALLTR